MRGPREGPFRKERRSGREATRCHLDRRNRVLVGQRIHLTLPQPRAHEALRRERVGQWRLARDLQRERAAIERE